MSEEITYDVAVIGGGINGTGIAANAASRNLNVFLCEQHDLASATSSASSKLIHGGLRYLENFEFRLVTEALNERERLLTLAKHLVKPQNFILPHQPELRSRAVVRLGLFLYDHLARHSQLPKTKAIHLKNHPAGHFLKSKYQYAFQYTDCRTDDARLVIANAQKAQACGATIATYTECVSVTRKQNYWELTLRNSLNDKITTITTRALVNATGPWVESFLKNRTGLCSQHSVSLIKGSHIVIPKFYEGDFAYILQNEDKRVIFVIPYLTDLVLVGTTDVVYHNDPSQPVITEEEIQYLIGVLNNHFTINIQAHEIIHTYAGVRPLLKDKEKNPSKITRDYLIEFDSQEPPFISIFGGKLTTFRALSEKVVNALRPFFVNMTSYNEANMILPGSEYNNEQELLVSLQDKYGWLPRALLSRYLQQYGQRTDMLLSNCNTMDSLGKDFGAHLHQREVDYLIEMEWATCSQDILWRRTKLGYFFPKDQIFALDEYIISKTQKLDKNSS